ncbi:MAG: rRNA maturation RNase YbeY [Elusimicrobiota bacterium]|jgi:probable rRNA maturation factor|nr:rRNA maturation RNase YbeY [Elusimicrobiota bacterium]
MKKQKILNFFNFNSKCKTDLQKCALSVLKSEKIHSCNINFILISDAEIKKLNRKYRKTNRITDVISFLIDPKTFTGDIYIARERSKKQAETYNHIWLMELAYLTIHGVLHLCGYSDYAPKNKKIMFKKQDEIFKCIFY